SLRALGAAHKYQQKQKEVRQHGEGTDRKRMINAFRHDESLLGTMILLATVAGNRHLYKMPTQVWPRARDNHVSGCAKVGVVDDEERASLNPRLVLMRRYQLAAAGWLAPACHR
ncbi:MAG TPA: hypothetical protein VGF86_13905, partial [Candidatus Tumulicola sp.]